MKQLTESRLFLVSAGIGDPENMTLRAVEVIRQADLILAMPFVQQQIAAFLPDGVPVIDPGHGLFTGLARQGRTESEPVDVMEARIREMIREYVRQGRRVVVVEFGDPTLFGPQAGYLTEFRDLAPELIPGISSFNAANGVLRQSLLSRRQHALTISDTKGLEHFQGSKPDVLVLFTMKLEIEALAENLLNIYPPETQVALVFHAGFAAKQQVVYVRLNQLSEKAQVLDIPWECLIYVGNISEVESGDTAIDVHSTAGVL